MKAFLASLLILSTGQLFGQTYSISIDQENVVATLEMTTSVEAIQSNLTNVELDLRMELLDLLAPADWDVFLCTPSFCAAPGEWDVLYGLDQAQAAQIKVSFSPGSTHGSATATWVVSDVNDPLSTDTFYISASTLVGVAETSSKSELVFQNSTEGLTVVGDHDQIELYRITGELILKEFTSNDRSFIRRREYLPGIYLLRVYHGGSVLTRKILF